MGIITPHIFKPEEQKNYLINGDMGIYRRGSSFVAAANNTFPVDRFVYRKVGTMVHTLSADTSDFPTVEESGYLFRNSLRLNLTTADTSLATSDNCIITQTIEGNNFLDLAGKALTLSFWVKSSLAGVYCVSFRNSGFDRSFVAEYTINTADTWEKKTIAVPAAPIDVGTWAFDTGAGLRVSWILCAGAEFQTTATENWQGGNFLSTANQVNATNTGVTDFKIVGTMLNIGSNAAPFKRFADSISGELVACQRYFQLHSNVPVTARATNRFACYLPLSITMRAAPTISLVGGTQWNTQGTDSYNQTNTPTITAPANNIFSILFTLDGFTHTLPNGHALYTACASANGVFMGLDAELV